MIGPIAKVGGASVSETVRQHARDTYLRRARHRGLTTFQINVGQLHRELALKNRIPLVCQALKSDQFLAANGLRLISETGPRSGQSTTVTSTYAFVDERKERKTLDRQDAWNRLRGALKDVFAEYGGGEAYLRAERASIRDGGDRKGAAFTGIRCSSFTGSMTILNMGRGSQPSTLGCSSDKTS